MTSSSRLPFSRAVTVYSFVILIFFFSKLYLAKLKNFHKVHVKILKPSILYKMLA